MMTRKRPQWVALIGPLGLMLAISLVSGTAQPAVPDSGFVYQDKVAHVLVFGLLATAWFRALPQTWSQATRSRLAVALAGGFGIVDEFHQSLIPLRQFELADMLADLVGAVLAVAVYVNWKGYRELLEWRCLSTGEATNAKNEACTDPQSVRDVSGSKTLEKQ